MSNVVQLRAAAVLASLEAPMIPAIVTSVLVIALIGAEFHYSAPQAGLRGPPSAALTTESSPDATLHQLGRKRLFESTEGVTVRGYRSSRPAKAVFKPLASLGFLIAAVQAGLLEGSPASTAVFVGLCFGALGDVLLIGRSKPFFLGGLTAFLLNHLAFVIAFLWIGIDIRWAALAVLPVLGIGAWVLRWLGPHVGRLRMPVTAYITVIGAMVITAAGVSISHPVLAVAAVLFFASDLFVARDRFIAPGPWNKVPGLPLYYAAQLLFALNG